MVLCHLCVPSSHSSLGMCWTYKYVAEARMKLPFLLQPETGMGQLPAHPLSSPEMCSFSLLNIHRFPHPTHLNLRCIPV